jgi:hypothetical protein
MWEYGCCCWRCFLITHNPRCNSSLREDGLQSRLEWRTPSNPQERWRNASAQEGRHIVCQDGLQSRLEWRSSKTELMRSKKSCTFMIPAWHVKNVKTLGIQGTTVLKFMRMWTLSTTTTVLNRIKDRISNNGQTTKVTISIILIINHPWES